MPVPTSDHLTIPVCVVADALFTGSIGGCPDSQTYRLALANLREHVFTLPDETILLPGHGPATTIGEERKRNPFFGVSGRANYSLIFWHFRLSQPP